MRNSSRSDFIQFGALPWRMAGGAIEILLITTQHSRRWIVPKGWPEADCAPHQSAALEALEEAGVSGHVAEAALGSFRYDKRRKSGEVVRCTVYVFPMKVAKCRRTWAEKRKRKASWCSPPEALARVSEPSLRRLISKFADVTMARRASRRGG